jgi:RNA polymerase sigma factor (sigma-70 family)
LSFPEFSEQRPTETPEAENHLLPGATSDTWRTWLMTGARRSSIDRRRMRGAYKGLKRMLIEGMSNGDGRPHDWADFSGAMIRHAVDEAIRTLPTQDTQAVKLAYFGGYSNREIARQIGLTESGVQRRLKKALAAISDNIEHGGALGRRALYVLAVWLSGRWLSEVAHNTVQVAAVATAAVIVVSYPAPVTAPPPAQAHAAQAQVTTEAKTVLSIPSDQDGAASLRSVSGVDHHAVDGRDLVVLASRKGGKDGVAAHRVHGKVTPARGRVDDKHGRVRLKV